MPYSEQERKRQASIKLKEFQAKMKKQKITYVNPNILRDVVAAHLNVKGLFKNYESARKWTTKWIASKL